MQNKRKIICLSITVLLLVIVFGSLITYSYFTAKDIIEGTFQVDISSKKVDTLSFGDKNECFVQLDSSNFRRDNGRNVSCTASLNTKLYSTNNDATYCYKVDVVLPDDKIFEYTDNKPELLLDVWTGDGKYYIKNKDITSLSGAVAVNNSDGSNIHKISSIANSTVDVKWNAKVTFVWKNIDQSINDQKSYSAKLRTTVVTCS